MDLESIEFPVQTIWKSTNLVNILADTTIGRHPPTDSDQRARAPEFTMAFRAPSFVAIFTIRVPDWRCTNGLFSPN